MKGTMIADPQHEDRARRPWRTQRLSPLVSNKGACEILGIAKSTLGHWQKPGSGTQGPDGTYMVPPLIVDGSGWPIWVREDVERFAEEIGRRRAPAGQAQAS